MKACRKWVFRIISLAVGATLVFVFIAMWLDLGMEVVWKVLAVPGAVAIVSLLKLARLSRTFIKITEKSIVWDCGQRPMVYRFRDIHHCEISSKSVEGKKISVLVIELRNSDREIFGVNPSVPDEVLRTTLEQRGVNVVVGTELTEEDIGH